MQGIIPIMRLGPNQIFANRQRDSLQEHGMISETSGELQTLESLWEGKLPDAERLTFLQFDPERRSLALLRLGVIQDFNHGRRSPGELMGRLSLGRSQFYKLLRDWKADPSLSSLVPFAGSAKVRSPKLSDGVVRLTLARLREYATSKRAASETTLIREIQADCRNLPWDSPDGPTIPADTSLRRLIAKLSFEDPALQLSAMARQQRKLDFADTFGGRVLVDHSTLDLICRNEQGEPIRPTISVVMDDASRLLLAGSISSRIPVPEDFIHILALAAAGYEEFRKAGLSTVAGLHTRLMMRNGTSSDWDALRNLAGQSRLKGEIRRAPQPVFGHVLRRSMVVKIGSYALLPRHTMHDPRERLAGVDLGKRPPVDWEVAQELAAVAIRDHNLERLAALPPELVTGKRGSAALRLNTEKKDFLAFGLGVFARSWSDGPDA